MADQNMLAAALRAAAAGLSVVPPRKDGTKAAEGYWKQYQSRRASPDEIEGWYSTGRDGVGVVTGAISGGLELFEFEGPAVEAGIWEGFQRATAALGLGDVLDRVRDGYCEDTPSGGLHLLWQCEEVEGSQKLARCVGKDGTPKTLMETRGEGGYSVVAPSGGRVHQTGGQYRLRSGGFETIVTVTPVGMGKTTRGVELKIMDDLDEGQIAEWMKQVAAMPGAGRNKQSAA